MPRKSKKENMNEMEWTYNNKSYLVSKEYEKKKKRNTKKTHYLTYSDFFQRLGNPNAEFLISIRDGKIVKDPIKVLLVVKHSLIKGTLMGTNEFLLRKLDKITQEISSINTTKANVLSNIYNSMISYIQSKFIINDIKVPKPKEIPQQIKKHRKKFGFDTKGIDKKIVSYITEIIDYHRDYNKGKIKSIKGKTLDELGQKLVLIKQAFGDIDG